MGLKIEYDKIFDSYEQTIQIMGALIANLNEMVEIEQAICYSRAIQSESATALKNYIQDIHWTGFLNLVIDCYTEINRIISSYMVGLQNLDTSIDAVIDEECLTNVETRMKQLDDELYTFAETMKSKAESVSHIMQLPVKSGENVSTGISAMAKEAVRVREDFIEYEENKKREVELYNNLMADLLLIGFGYVLSSRNLVSNNFQNELFGGLSNINQMYSNYYVQIDYSSDQARHDVDQMQNLLAVHKNKQMEDKQIHYAYKTAIAIAYTFSSTAKAFALFRAICIISASYNLNQCSEAWDAGKLATTWDTDREAKAIVNLQEGSRAKAIYTGVGFLTTFIVEKVSTKVSTDSIKNMLEYQMLPDAIKDTKDGLDKLKEWSDLFNMVQGWMPSYSKAIKEGTTYEKIRELEESGRQ